MSVRLTPTDLERILSASDILWPGAQLSNSGTIRALVLRQVDSVLARRKPKDGNPVPGTKVSP